VDVKQLDVTPAREQVKNMGPMSKKEKESLVILGLAAVLWVGGPFIETALGFPRTLFSSAVVAVMAVCYMAIRTIITWEDLKGVSWGIFLIIGAGLSLGETLSRTGVTDWFSTLISPLVTGPSFLVSLMLLVLISALLTNLLNNTTIAAVFVPVLITLAGALPSLDAVQLVLPVTLATTFGYSLPSASGRMALMSASGIVSKGKMMHYGLIMTVISSVVLALAFYGMEVFGLI
jgi:sodium-dependent dicarboxylate transporter 2/3/5